MEVDMISDFPFFLPDVWRYSDIYIFITLSKKQMFISITDIRRNFHIFHSRAGVGPPKYHESCQHEIEPVVSELKFKWKGE